MKPRDRASLARAAHKVEEELTADLAVHRRARRLGATQTALFDKEAMNALADMGEPKPFQLSSTDGAPNSLLAGTVQVKDLWRRR